MNTRQYRKDQEGPYCWQNKQVLRLLANYYGNKTKKLRTARSIYVAFTELVSNAGNNYFCAVYRSHIAKLSGTSSSTIDRYTQDFILLGLIEKENRRICSFNIQNKWFLLKCPHNSEDTLTEQETSPHNKYQTSTQKYEELYEENNKKKNIKELFESESYKKLRKMAQSLKHNATITQAEQESVQGNTNENRTEGEQI